MTTQAKKKVSMGDLLMKLGPLMVLAILYVVFTFSRQGRFLTMANQMNVLKQTAVNCLIGSGMLLALITAGIAAPDSPRNLAPSPPSQRSTRWVSSGVSLPASA